MKELKVEGLLGRSSLQVESDSDRLALGERLIRLSVMTAFIAVIAFEIWLIWQVVQLF
ncbi:MAG: hypothetical protein GTO18_20890 [Anaerolineales bacterium]|nr:hypothetical protein [Anaerolineales bacterium]